MTVLVIDAGTSGVRAVAIGDDGAILADELVEVLPDSPAPGLVEVDAVRTAEAAVSVAGAVQRRVGRIDAVGIANQRATTVAWDGRTGVPVGPGIGWQDLRTVGRCLELQAEGVRVAPNATATKAEWLLQHADVPVDAVRIGTIDTWLAWHLTGGQHHVTDASNALVTGLFDPAAGAWDSDLVDAARDPGVGTAPCRRLGWRGGRRRRPRGRPGARCTGGRPAGLTRRSGVRPAWRGQDHVRHRRDARRLSR